MSRRAVLLALAALVLALAVATALVGPRRPLVLPSRASDVAVATSAPELRADAVASHTDARAPVAATPSAHDVLRVRVLDRSTEAPVAGAEVCSLPPGFEPRQMPDEDNEVPDYLEWSDRNVALVERAGVTTRTDDAGVAEIMARFDDTVIARAGNRFGAAQLIDARAEGVYEIHVARDREVSAVVRDARGQPRSGVQVQLVDDFAEAPVRAAITDAGGIVHFPHVQDAVGWSLSNDGAPRVSLAVLAGEETVVTAPVIWPANRARAEAALELPALGRLVVEVVTASGRPAHDVRGAEVAFTPDDPAMSIPGRKDGDARFRWDALHPRDDLYVWTNLGGILTEHPVAGPRDDGERVTARVFVEEQRSMRVRGRLVGPEGEELADVRLLVWASMADQSFGVSSMSRPDADGRFAAELWYRADLGLAPLLNIAVTSAASRHTIERAVDPTAAEIDVGDVVMERPPLLASGRVTSEGRPVAGAWLRFEQETNHVWNWMPNVGMPRSREGGLFEVRAALPEDTPLRVVASTEWGLSDEHVFTRGDRGIELSMEGLGKVVISCHSSDGFPDRQIVAELLDAAGVVRASQILEKTRAPRARAVFAQVAPGPYQLRVKLVDDPQPCAVAALEVRAGETTSLTAARELELSPPLRVVHVTIGGASEETMCHLQRGDPYDTAWVSPNHGDLAVALVGGRCDVLVLSDPRCVPVLLENVTSDARVSLRRKCCVTVAPSLEGATLPEGWRISAHVEIEEAYPQALRAALGRASQIESAAVSLDVELDDLVGLEPWPLVPGQRLTVRATLSAPGGAEIALPDAASLHFTAPEGGAPQTVRWKLPIAVLRDAIASAEQPR